MKPWPILFATLLITGCTPTLIDRAALDARYESTALAEGVLSAPPRLVDPTDPPRVVQWWYAGTRNARHYLVCRELTWDAGGKPVGVESWYRVPADQLEVQAAFDKTVDDTKWLPLFEASADIPPPADLPTARSRRDPVRAEPARPRELDRVEGEPLPIEIEDAAE
ncbi:MAG: hypothetical protein ACE37H_02085 [Phycisphaeraceae bacterium]